MNMWQKRTQQRHPFRMGGNNSNNNNSRFSDDPRMSHSSSNHNINGQQPTVVGTEALAQQHLERNAAQFLYPPVGFVTKIEHSLLYSMIQSSAPVSAGKNARTTRNKVQYPVEVLEQAIADEDFAQYMELNSSKPDDNTTLYSSAQLSAILALAAETLVSKANTNTSTVEPTMQRQRDPDPPAKPEKSLPQVLCQALIRTVIRHAEEHGDDRESSVQALLEPLERLTKEKDMNQAKTLIVPMYLGFGASLLLGGNPIPMYMGWALGGALSNDGGELQNQESNLRELSNTTTRAANVETASLLDEADD